MRRFPGARRVGAGLLGPAAQLAGVRCAAGAGALRRRSGPRCCAAGVRCASTWPEPASDRLMPRPRARSARPRARNAGPPAAAAAQRTLATGGGTAPGGASGSVPQRAVRGPVVPARALRSRRPRTRDPGSPRRTRAPDAGHDPPGDPRDCVALNPLTQPVLARAFSSQSFARDLDGLDLVEVVSTGRALLSKEPHTRARAGRAARGALARPRAGFAGARRDLPRSCGAGTAPRRVGFDGRRPLDHDGLLARRARLPPDLSRDKVVTRYLAAFGPATVADIRTWSGFTGLREVMERLRPRLCTFADESGRELFDLVDAPRPDPETPAPPRFLPEYDNLLLSHADRSRVIAEEDRPRVFGKGAVLVDGYVAAHGRSHAALPPRWRSSPSRRSRSTTARGHGGSGAAARLRAPGAETRDVQILPARRVRLA